MRSYVVLFTAIFVLCSQVLAQSCTGYGCPQVQCSNGGTTSVSGTVYAPNGTDPLPNVLVYVPTVQPAAFTAGVSCPVVGQAPSGSPLVGATSAVDGTFTITNMPVGADIPLVILSGKWRRQLTIPNVASCTNTPLPSTFAVMPQDQSQGDIPKFAIATGSVDQVECVLRKVGIKDSEFTDPSGAGRINLYSGSNSPGALIDSSTPSQTTLMENATTLNSYDVLMLPCQGGQFTQPAVSLSNFISFANAGGRVYSSHYSYVWMYNNAPLNGVANWDVNQGTFPDGTATVDTSFSAGQTLAQWLQLVGASTTQGQIGINTLKHDLNGVIAPTQSWLTLNTTGNPVMQFVFNAPVGTTANQCGRVLFNEYHVENPPSSPTGKAFPTECSSAAMTAQEKLLEYSLFELTSDGGQPTLAPTSLDFGSVPLGFTSAAQSVAWTNNSTFAASATSLTASGDYSVASNNCSSVTPGASCQINVVFTPTALGTRTGTLTVGSSGNTLTASLTGIGIPDVVISTQTLGFGNVDVGASVTQPLALTNNTSAVIAIPAITTTGNYTATANCGSTLAVSASCIINVTFTPATTGPLNGTLNINSPGSSPITLTGNGVDFTIALNPTSGGVVAGNSTTTSATISPIAGYDAAITLSCTTNAAASTCIPMLASVVPTTAATTTVTITTTSQYTVVGYSGAGGGDFLWLIAWASGCLLWMRRRSAGKLARCLLIVICMAASCCAMTGCSGTQPAKNAVYTTPGTYTYTVTATDGFLVHSATYSLKVVAQ